MKQAMVLIFLVLLVGCDTFMEIRNLPDLVPDMPNVGEVVNPTQEVVPVALTKETAKSVGLVTDSQVLWLERAGEVKFLKLDSLVVLEVYTEMEVVRVGGYHQYNKTVFNALEVEDLSGNYIGWIPAKVYTDK